MALMDDIRSDLIDESASVSNTLRKAKMLAYDLELPEFREWVDSELNGYPDLKKCLTTDVLALSILALLVAPSRRWQGRYHFLRKVYLAR